MHNYSREQIELRAYQLWEERGRPADTSDVDWLMAEAELREAKPAFSRVAHRFGTILGSMVATVQAITKGSLRVNEVNPWSETRS
jgi:hypothetical protein